MGKDFGLNIPYEDNSIQNSVIYKKSFSIVTPTNYLKLNGLNHKEAIKGQLIFQLAKDLAEWLEENDYVKYEVGNYFTNTYPEERTEIRGEISFKFNEIPKRYKKEIIIEKL